MALKTAWLAIMIVLLARYNDNRRHHACNAGNSNRNRAALLVLAIHGSRLIISHRSGNAACRLATAHGSGEP